MDIRDLIYFQAVAENGNITRAAQELHITQPTISRQLQILENELNVTLLIRGKRHIELTPAGEVFLKKASSILSEINHTAKEMENYKDEFTATLSIATNDSLSMAITSPIIAAFHRKYPRITFELYSAQAQKMAQLLCKNVVDVAFMMTPVDDSLLNYMPIQETHLGIAMPSTNAIGEQDDIIYFSELRNIPLILPNRFRFPILEAFWNKGYGNPQILCDSHSVHNDLKWVEENIGVSVCPSLCTAYPGFQSGQLIFKKLVDPEFSYTAVLAWNKKVSQSTATSHFIDFLQQQIQEKKDIFFPVKPL